ncbi:MAG: response regulator transcription factor [Nitrospinae bacterium]|nr:response regulator transcription factor [Nitrospinota bacterium]
MKAFLVDDSPMALEQLGAMLFEMGDVEIVGEAGNVQDAEQGILRSRPDVVILDIQIAGGSGVDVLRTVKKALPSLKVVVLTNHPFFQYRVKCMAWGADYFLDKHNEYVRIPGIVRQLRWAGERPDSRGEDLP